MRTQVDMDFDTSADKTQLTNQKIIVIAVSHIISLLNLRGNLKGWFCGLNKVTEMAKMGTNRPMKIHAFPRIKAGAASPRHIPAAAFKAPFFITTNILQNAA